MICDLAQTYGIFNYKDMSPDLVATLALGLPDHSRVKMKICKQRLTLEQGLLAFILDDLNLLLWSKQKKRGRRPKSIYKTLTAEKKPKDELKSFDSEEAYEAWMAQKRKDWENNV